MTLPRDEAEKKPVVARWGAVCALSLSVVALIVGEMLPASLLTVMATDLHVSEGLAGQAVTATSITAFFSSLLMSTVTRRLDRRSVLLALAALLASSNLIVALAVNYPMLLVGRVLLGLGLGGFWSMAAAVCTRLVPPPMIPRALSMIYGSVSIGLVAVLPLGTFLSGSIGWRGIFLGTTALAVIAFVWQLFVLPSMKPTGRSTLGTLLELFKRPQLQVGNACAFLVYGAHFMFFTYVRPFLEGVAGFDGSGIAAILLGFGIANIIGTAFAGAMIRTSLRFTLASMPLLMAVVASALVFLGDSKVVAAGLVTAWGFTFGVLPVSWATWLTRAAPDELESANGLRVSGIQMAIATSAAIGGLLLDGYGPRTPLIGAGLIGLVAAALVFAKVRSPPSTRAPEAS